MGFSLRLVALQDGSGNRFVFWQLAVFLKMLQAAAVDLDEVPASVAVVINEVETSVERDRHPLRLQVACVADALVISLEVQVDSEAKVRCQSVHEIAFDPVISHGRGVCGIAGIINHSEYLGVKFGLWEVGGTDPETEYSCRFLGGSRLKLFPLPICLS